MMEAGRELDALVAEKVMGWHRVHDGLNERWADVNGYGAYVNRGDGTPPPGMFWSPSTDIAAAWQVVEHMRLRWDHGNSTTDFWTIKDCGPSGWRVEIEFCPDHDAPIVIYAETPPTAPLAICLAALKAVGVEP